MQEREDHASLVYVMSDDVMPLYFHFLIV